MPPSASEIEAALRRIVADLYAAERYADLTVKRVRVAAEQQLGLDDGWFKADDEWNTRSKDVISSEVVSMLCYFHLRAARSQPNGPVSRNCASKLVGVSWHPTLTDRRLRLVRLFPRHRECLD
jgi:hypothetical protein